MSPPTSALSVAQHAPTGHGDPLGRIAVEALDDLRASARRLLNRERRSHTLSPTALVNEAYLRLAAQHTTWTGRQGFMAMARVMMTRVLSNHGRDRRAHKRGGGRVRVEFDEAIHHRADRRDTDLVCQCLARLHTIDPRAAEIAYLRLYRGATNDVIAEVLDMSTRTVEREWAATRAWVRAELAEGAFA